MFACSNMELRESHLPPKSRTMFFNCIQVLRYRQIRFQYVNIHITTYKYRTLEAKSSGNLSSWSTNTLLYVNYKNYVGLNVLADSYRLDLERIVQFPHQLPILMTLKRYCATSSLPRFHIFFTYWLKSNFSMCGEPGVTYSCFLRCWVEAVLELFQFSMICYWRPTTEMNEMKAWFLFRFFISASFFRWFSSHWLRFLFGAWFVIWNI